MSLLDYLRVATQNRNEFSPQSGELLDKDHNAFDLTEWIKSLFGQNENDVELGSVNTTNNLFGIPKTFTKMTRCVADHYVAKGALNKIRLRPSIMNEHVESSREIQGVVESDNIVGQIFKASQDNINGIYLTLESGDAQVFDNFETYANDEELQASWIEQGITPGAELETNVLPDEGTRCMKLSGQSTSYEWIKTFTSQSFTGAIGSLQFRQTRAYNALKLQIFIGDGTNTKSYNLVVDNENEWFKIDINEGDMTEDQGGITDTANITQMGFRVEDSAWGHSFYIDNINYVAKAGEVDLKLFDMGTTLPEDGVTKLSDGTQHEQLKDISWKEPVSEIRQQLKGGKRMCFVTDFVAGTAKEIPDNQLLIPGHYYAITINYVDTQVNVWGNYTPWEIQYYNNGYAFTTPDEVSVINQVGEFANIKFSIFSTQDVYITGGSTKADSQPDADVCFQAFVEGVNMETLETPMVNGVAPGEAGIMDMRDRPAFMPKGGKAELHYNDVASDNVTKIDYYITFIYEPPTVNG